MSVTLEPESRPTRVRYTVLAVLCSLAFLTYLDRICVARAKDEMTRDLGFGELTAEDEQLLQDEGKTDDPVRRAQVAKARSESRFSWVFSAFLWGYLMLEVPLGWLGDTFGPRKVIVGIVLWWSLFTALTGSVDGLLGVLSSHPGPGLLLIGLVLVRCCVGLGEAGAFPNISLVLPRWFPFRSRAGAQGAIWMCSRLGGALSYVIFGLLLRATGGWRPAFLALGLVGLVWSVLFHRWFRNRPEEMASVNGAELALIREGAVQKEASHGGVPWLRILGSTNLWALYLTAAAVSYSWYFYVNYLPGYLYERFKVSYDQSEWQSGLPLLCGGLACLAGGRLSDLLVRRTGSKRWGRSLPGLVGFGAAGAINFLLPALNTWGLVIAAVCVAFAFQDLAIPVIWTVTADVGGKYTGTVAGCMNCVGGIGGALSPLLTTKLANAYGFNVVMLSTGCVYLLGALLWLRINAGEPLQGPQGTTPD
jgi:MFS family permease